MQFFFIFLHVPLPVLDSLDTGFKDLISKAMATQKMELLRQDFGRFEKMVLPFRFLS